VSTPAGTFFINTEELCLNSTNLQPWQRTMASHLPHRHNPEEAAEVQIDISILVRVFACLHRWIESISDLGIR
jgi:hypothetical protein